MGQAIPKMFESEVLPHVFAMDHEPGKVSLYIDDDAGGKAHEEHERFPMPTGRSHGVGGQQRRRETEQEGEVACHPLAGSPLDSPVPEEQREREHQERGELQANTVGPNSRKKPSVSPPITKVPNI